MKIMKNSKFFLIIFLISLMFPFIPYLFWIFTDNDIFFPILIVTEVILAITGVSFLIYIIMNFFDV